MVRKLFTNHLDAWGLTLIISSLALFVHTHFSLEAVLLALATALSYWLGFALNDYFDVPVDARDSRKSARNFFIQRQLPGVILLLVFALTMMVILAVFIHFGLRGMALFAIGHLVMWAYSAPPLRLKSRPILDLLTHALFVETFPYFTMIYLLDLAWQPIDSVLLATFFLASLAAQLEQQARDFKFDSLTETNFTIRFGLTNTIRLLRLSTALLLGIVIFHIVTGVIPPYLVPLGLAALPVMLHRFIRRGHQPRSEALIRFALLVAMAYASIVWAQMVLA